MTVLPQDEAGDAAPGVNRIAVVDETTVLVAAARELKVRWGQLGAPETRHCTQSPPRSIHPARPHPPTGLWGARRSPWRASFSVHVIYTTRSARSRLSVGAPRAQPRLPISPLAHGIHLPAPGDVPGGGVRGRDCRQTMDPHNMVQWVCSRGPCSSQHPPSPSIILHHPSGTAENGASQLQAARADLLTGDTRRLLMPHSSASPGHTAGQSYPTRSFVRICTCTIRRRSPQAPLSPLSPPNDWRLELAPRSNCRQAGTLPLLDSAVQPPPFPPRVGHSGTNTMPVRLTPRRPHRGRPGGRVEPVR